MDGLPIMLIWGGCTFVGAIAAIVVNLLSAERCFGWRFPAGAFALAISLIVASFMAGHDGATDDKLFWPVIAFFALLFVAIGWTIGATIGWLLRLGRDRL